MKIASSLNSTSCLNLVPRANMQLKTIILLTVLSNVRCATPTASFCDTAKTCDACIGLSGCTWCSQLSKNEIQRCNTLQGNEQNGCLKSSIIESLPSTNIPTQNIPLSKTMPIFPQKVSARLSVGKVTTIDFSFRDDTDRRLDLYYIMDLSATMADDKVTVANQARDLAKALRTITRDVQLGFGSFIDKPVLPFVSSSQLRGDDKNYAPPYGFKNELRLTPDESQFKKKVENAKQSHNLDEPEGTLDALMQAIVCKDEIGWRNESRKLIVVATDGPFHIAGDGKLGGIVRPNDMKCHMKNNMSTHSTILDYPSIGEMNAVILQNKVYVIFAVSKSGQNVYSVYEQLKNHISQSTVAELKADSSNVVEEIRKKYLEISRKVELKEESPDHIDVKVMVKCPGRSFEEGKVCTDVRVQNPKVEYKISLSLKKCPDSRPRNGQDKVIISFFELDERLEISIDYACTCNCSKSSEREHLERFCTNPDFAEHISCGMCTCKNGHYGHACQCSEHEKTNETSCIKAQGNDVCEGKGDCKCGRCECKSGFNGEFCEDATSGCQKDQDPVLCSGPHRGICKKGMCECYSGYDGKFCECETSKKDVCIEPGKTLHCNGHGKCNCDLGQCACDPGYKGLYCNVCKVNCQGNEDMLRSRCQDPLLKKCIGCLISKRIDNSSKADDDYLQLCDEDCNKYKYTTGQGSKGRSDVNRIDPRFYAERASLLEKDDGVLCTLQLLAKGRTCSYNFKYSYHRKVSMVAEDDLEVHYTSEETICEKEVPYLWIIIGTMLGVLLAGIVALLVWKLATHLHDTREYQRFEKERHAARFQGGENPLYLNPMSETQNPAYTRKK